MTLEVWAVQTALPTSSSGTTDLAHGLVPTTPNAALHFVGQGITNGSAQSNAGKLSIGATDGTNQRSASVVTQDAQATTNTNMLSTESGCVVLPFAGSAGEDGIVSHNSFISGGQRVNNDNGFTSAYLCNSLFFDADNVALETATLNATVDVAVNVDPGFAWDVVIIFGIPRASPSAIQDAEIFLGFYDKTTQGGIMWNSQDAQAAGDPAMQVSTTYVGGELSLGSGALDYGILASVGAGTSLDLTPKNAGGDGDEVYCLFLGGGLAKVFAWDSPASTGSDAHTGIGFTPTALLNIHTFAAAYDAAEADGDAGAFGISIETADDQFCVAIADEDAAATTNTQGMTDNNINVPYDDGTAGDVATLTSLDANGFTHSYSAAEGTANKQLTLALAGSGGIIPQAMFHYRNHGKI